MIGEAVLHQSTVSSVLHQNRLQEDAQTAVTSGAPVVHPVPPAGRDRVAVVAAVDEPGVVVADEGKEVIGRLGPLNENYLQAAVGNVVVGEVVGKCFVVVAVHRQGALHQQGQQKERGDCCQEMVVTSERAAVHAAHMRHRRASCTPPAHHY